MRCFALPIINVNDSLNKNTTFRNRFDFVLVIIYLSWIMATLTLSCLQNFFNIII